MKTTQYVRQEKAIDTSWYVEQERRIADASRPKVGEYVSLPAAATVSYGHIYVIEFSTGVVKVGRSINPKQRLATHSRVALVHGVEVRRSWTSERHHGCGETERLLIAFCRRQGTQIDAEYFRGITFEDAQAFAHLLAEAAIHDQFVASRIADDKKRRAYVESLVEAVDGDLNATWLDAHNRLSREEQEEHAAAIGNTT